MGFDEFDGDLYNYIFGATSLRRLLYSWHSREHATLQVSIVPFQI